VDGEDNNYKKWKGRPTYGGHPLFIMTPMETLKIASDGWRAEPLRVRARTHRPVDETHTGIHREPFK
jgi:hypothetical protein